MKFNLPLGVRFFLTIISCTLITRANAQTETFSTGSFIVNMGVVPQTVGNALKPYGMVYDLIKNHNVPVKWVISQTKSKDGTDFTYNGTSYNGGTFIIPAEYRSAAVNGKIASWALLGVVGTTTTSSLTVNVSSTLAAVPRWTLDAANGSIAQGFLTNAGITLTAFPNAYNWKSPATLDCCDDFFVMPHANPVWSTHGNLWTWNKNCLGSIWLGCHAGSALENMVNPANRSQQTNFLVQKDPSFTGVSGDYATSNSLLLWGSHSGGSIPYTHRLPTDPVAQYLGTTDAAQLNGSEQIYIPRQGSAFSKWNPGVKIIAYDPTQLNVPTLNPDLSNAAAVIAYGRGFDSSNRGYVMYEASHNISGTAPANIAAQRAFLNFSFFQIQPKAPNITVTGVTGGQVIPNSGGPISLSVSATSPLSGISFSYQWTSSCGGTFSAANTANTTFNPATASVGTCAITCIVSDNCGRKTFQSFPIVITAGPQPPVPTADAGTISSLCGIGTSITTNVLANDNSPQAKPLSLTSVTSGGTLNGTFSFTGSGEITYTPSFGFIGSQVINYTVCDNTTPVPLCANSTFTITVGSGSIPAPVADAVTIAEDNIAVINVLANDGGGLTITGIPVLSSNGNVSINTDGTITYFPNADFAGTDNFTYRVKNAAGNYSNATVTVTVTNDACDGNSYQSVAGGSGSYSQNPQIDVYLDQQNPAKNFGSCAIIRVDGDGGSTKTVRGALKFDLSSIPSNATITSASLALEATTVKSTTSYQIDIHRITNTWNDGNLCNSTNTAGSNGATWTNRNFSTAWTAAGGDYNATIAASTNVSATGSYSWSGSNFTSMIQNWVNGTNTNYGMLLKFNTETSGNQNKDFNSGTAASNKPVLTINYTTPATCAPIPSRPPLSMPDTTTTLSNSAVTFNVLNNDNLFAAPTALIISIAPIAAQGTATANLGAGTVTFTPNPTFNGIASFQYKVTTANGSDSVIVYINVKNSPVVAADDNPAGANSGLVQTITVKANDLDPEGAVLTVAITNAPKNGTATINGSGQVVYTPNTNFTGKDTLYYAVCEPAPACGSPYCDTAMVVITVLNRAPVANADSKTILPCQANTIDLLANDTDPEGHKLILTGISPLSNPAAGTLLNNNDGTVTFTPTPGFSGTVTFTYSVTDNGDTPQTSGGPATVTIIVFNPPNTAPVAVNDTDATNMDQELFSSVRDNDYDPENQNLTIPLITVPPLHGTATVNPANGLIDYIPNPGFAGTDVLTYQICDNVINQALCTTSIGLCTTATLTITIEAPNTVNAVNDENSTSINTPVSGAVIANDNDPQGDGILFSGFIDGAGNANASGSITVSGVDAAGAPVVNAGTLTINANGTYLFTPANNFTGVVTVPYAISDNNINAAVDTAILRITVSPLPAITNSIIANNDENTSYGSPVTGNVTGNDRDPQGNTFTLTAFNFDSNGDGTMDGTGTVGTPVIIGGKTTTGLPVSNAGSLTLNTDGSYTFTPATDFHGSVDIPYTICDQGVAPQACQSAILHIDVLPDPNGPSNDPPAAGDDFNITNVNTPVSGNFINNDSDPNADSISLNGTTINTSGSHTAIGSPVTTAQGGTVQYYADGTYLYTPAPGFTGPDSVGYTICDVTAVTPQPLCNQAFLHLLVSVNNSTDAVNDENSTWQDVNVSGSVTDNDFDAENHTQTFGSFILQNLAGDITSGATLSGSDKTGTPVPNAGVLTFAADGSYTFDPSPSFTGTVTVPYRICDNGNQSKCDTAYLTITVDPLPTSGINNVIANNDENISYGSAVGGNLVINDRDPQSNSFTVTGITGGLVGTGFTVTGVDLNGNLVSNAGTLTVLANGTYIYSPASGFVGSINVPYTITDALGALSSAVLHIDVVKDPNGPANDPPLAGDDFGYTTINTAVNGNFINNDSDPNNDPISLNGTTLAAGGAHNPIGVPVPTAQGGTVQFYTDGTYLYTPPAGYVGPDNVKYSICDVTVVSPQPLCTDAVIHLLVGPGINISGKIWNDANGNVIDPGAAEPETNAGGTLYVNLLDGSGNVVATTAVAADGTYNFTNVNPGVNYSLQLSTNQGTAGLPAPALALPLGWVNTGETRNGTIDGGTTGVIDTRNYGFTNTVNYDFGIERLPDSDPLTTGISQPSINLLITLSGGSNPPVLSGSDPEDCSSGCPITTHSVIIDAVPANSQLYYNGILVTAGQQINNFNPALLQIKITLATVGSNSTSFQYSFVDAAGKKDPTPATYTLTWGTPLPVTGLQLMARLNNSTIELNWKTLNEFNSHQFVIERSLDNLSFLSIGTLAASGNSSSARNYASTDPVVSLMQQENIYYRIRQVDLDGRFTLSNVAVVRIGKTAGIKIWPNPFTSSITINMFHQQNAILDIRLVDLSGRTMIHTNQKCSVGASQINLNYLDRIAPGIYLLEITNQNTGIKNAFKVEKSN